MKATVPSGLLMGLFLIWGSSYPSVDSALSTVSSSMRNATFMEPTPDFTDLYLIETSDKGRRIVIYCNSVLCYKQRSQTLHS